MRSINLSRLARASEATFFKNEQAQQAKNLRKSLVNNDIISLESTTTAATIGAHSSKSELSADILPEIAAHSTYRELVRITLTDTPVRQKSRTLLSRIATAVKSNEKNSTVNRGDEQSGFTEPNLLRALGSSRFSLYQDAIQMQRSKPSVLSLPGGERYAEGTAVGLASLSIATAAVALVGATGAVVLWKRPSIVDSWRDHTISLRKSLDRYIGEPLRNSFGQRIQNGSLLSIDSRDRATAFARSAVGTSSPPSRNEPDAESDH